MINCGHGPVLYIDDQTGSTSIIGSATVPLGLIDFSLEKLEPWQGNLASAALYIVTDGITEARHGGDELGFDGLVAEAGTHQGMNGSGRVAQIMRRFLSGELSTHDDATLLVVTGIQQTRKEISRRRECTLDASIDALSKSRAFVESSLKAFGWQDRSIDIQLAIGEVMQNIIRHGFNGGKDTGKISMDMGFVDDDLECIITDTAPASDPENWLARGEQRRPDEGGHGLNIINEIASSYDVNPGEGNNAPVLYSPRQQWMDHHEQRRVAAERCRYPQQALYEPADEADDAAACPCPETATEDIAATCSQLGGVQRQQTSPGGCRN